MNYHRFLILAMLVSALGAAVPAQQDTKKPVSKAEVTNADAVTYTCPMHPKVVSSTPGTCPDCGMALVKQKSNSATPKASRSKMKADKAKSEDCANCGMHGDKATDHSKMVPTDSTKHH